MSTTRPTNRALSGEHRQYLLGEGIDAEYLDSLDGALWSYDGDTMLPAGFEWLDGSSAHTGGGIVFSWKQHDGTSVLQLRPDAPAQGSKGSIKYVGPTDARTNGVELLRYGIVKQAVAADSPVYVVEGSKQAHAAAAALGDVSVVFMPGATAWLHGMPGDLAASGLFRGRRVVVVVDADASTNRAVYDGAKAAGDAAKAAGAKGVQYLQIPRVGDNPTTGLDDYLASLDADARGRELQELAAVALSKPATSAPRARKSMAVTEFQGELRLDHNDLWDGADLRVEAAAKAILAYAPAARLSSGSLAWYVDGAYRPAEVPTDRRLNSMIGRLLGDNMTTGRAANISARIQGLVTDSGLVINDEDEAEPLVNARNGILDLRTGEMREHTPDHLSTRQLAVDIDMDGGCPFYDQWIEERCGKEQAATFDALMAEALDPSQISSRVGFFFGASRSGKSTALRIVREVFGSGQVSGVSLKQFEDSPYAAAELYGKSVNIAADLSRNELKDLSTFKTLTGEDTIFASKKYGQAFSFTNRASMLFSGNEPPPVPAEDAYFNRMLGLLFPRSYAGAEDPTVEERLMEELPAIVARWCRAYGTRPQEQPFVGELFRGRSDRVARFLSEATVPCTDDVVPGMMMGGASVATSGAATPTQLHEGFLMWAEAEGGAKMGRNTLMGRAEALGVERIRVGQSCRRAVSVRILDMDEWGAADFTLSEAEEHLWPSTDDDDDEGPDAGPGPTPEPEPTPPTPTPTAPAVEAATGQTVDELATKAAEHFGVQPLDKGFFSAVFRAALLGDSEEALARRGDRGNFDLVPPSLTLAELTEAGPLSSELWTRGLVATTSPVLTAAGIRIRERRLQKAGELSSWTTKTTGSYVSKADKDALYTRHKEAVAAGRAAKKAGDHSAAQAYEEEAARLSLETKEANGLPDELTAYAVAVDPDALLAALSGPARRGVPGA